MSKTDNKPIEGVFFVHGQKVIEKDWCPLCNKWTKFANPVSVKMDHIEKRKMNCGHEITFIFLVEHVCEERVKVVRKRIC